MRRRLPAIAMLAAAGAIVAAWAVLQAAGWREHTGVLSVAIPYPGYEDALLKAMVYAAVHLLLVLAVPILMLAAALLHILTRARSRIS